MDESTFTDPTATRPTIGLRRVAMLSAVVAFGLLAPAAAGASPASPHEPPAPGGSGDLTLDDPCDPALDCPLDPGDECGDLEICDDPGDEDPGDECHPLAATCDFAPGGNGPDDPGEEPTDDPDPKYPPARVDAPVCATPNYTG